jgi:hypothetical protein
MAGVNIDILKGASTNSSSTSFSLPPLVTLAIGGNDSSISYPTGFSLTVTWTNNDTVPHELNLYSGGGICATPRLIASSGEIYANQSFSYSFGSLGT